jgi:hypothetical protein
VTIMLPRPVKSSVAMEGSPLQRRWRPIMGCLARITDVAQQRIDLTASLDQFLRPAPVFVVSVPPALRRTASSAVHPAYLPASHCRRTTTPS